MRRVAIGACYVVAPVLAPFVVVVLFLTGVTLQTSFRDLLRRFFFERPNFGFVSAALDVCLAWAMARFATLPLRLPARFGKLGMSSPGEAGVLFFVAGFAGFASNVIFGRVLCGRRRLGFLLISQWS